MTRKYIKYNSISCPGIWEDVAPDVTVSSVWNTYLQDTLG